MSSVLDAPLSDLEAMRVAMGEMRVASSELAARIQLSRAMGLTYDGKRDLATAFGYKDLVTVADYRLRYERGGIAGRIVDAIAKATWRGGCELIEDENPDTLTEFEAGWASLDDRLNLVAELQAADILARVGAYSVLLIGDGGDVTQPLGRGNGSPDGIVYLSPYGGSELGMGRGSQRTFSEALEGLATASVLIDGYDRDPRSPRFGQPVGYRLRRLEFTDANLSNQVVHWSRVVHFAEGGLDNRVFGRPALQRSWNDLDSLDKVIGGGAEAFFQRANQGRVWSINKDIRLDAGEKEDFRKQIEELQHNIVRDVRGRGLTVDTLSSDVANFANQLDAILTILAGSNEIPKRILTGSEMGELASSQDRDNWRDQVNGRRENYAAPFMVRRLVQRLIDFNYLSKPKQYKPKWGSVLNMTEDEKKNKAMAWAQVNATNKTVVFLDSEIRQQCYEMAPLTAEDIAADRAVQPEPVAPVALAAFPRAAADVVDRLAEAVEANDTATIDAIIGVTHG